MSNEAPALDNQTEDPTLIRGEEWIAATTLLFIRGLTIKDLPIKKGGKGDGRRRNDQGFIDDAFKVLNIEPELAIHSGLSIYNMKDHFEQARMIRLVHQLKA